jgi:hypothetical protein
LLFHISSRRLSSRISISPNAVRLHNSKGVGFAYRTFSPKTLICEKRYGACSAGSFSSSQSGLDFYYGTLLCPYGHRLPPFSILNALMTV